tara:strand:+ start:1115 stop:1414 length:300 start_codon:yes stop_codon:yes gene_type:complete
MAIRTTTVVTRPNTGIDWYSMNDTYKEYCRKTFHATGKRELVSVTVSADKLVKTVVTDYVDSEAKYAFANDSTMQEYMNERDLHYITHGVTMKRTAETV